MFDYILGGLGAIGGSLPAPGVGTALGGSLGYAAGAGLDQLFGIGGKTGTPGGYDIIEPTQWSRASGLMDTQADWLQDEYARLQSGRFPGWYEGISPLLKKQQMQGLREQYYGTPGLGGQVGNLGTQAAYDVARGEGRSPSAGRNMGTQLDRMAQQERAIEDYISSLGYQAQGSSAQQLPGWTNAAVQTGTNMLNQGRGIYPVQPQADPWAQIGTTAMSALPWLSGMGAGMSTGAGMGIGGGQLLQPLMGQGQMGGNWDQYLNQYLNPNQGKTRQQWLDQIPISNRPTSPIYESPAYLPNQGNNAGNATSMWLR